MRNLKLREEERFDTIREYINRGIKKYKNNTAFIIKHQKDKNVEYEKITYKKFEEDVNNLGTGLINLGFENKRIAIIWKNCYEWVLSYITTLVGVGIAVPLDKGLQKEEIILSLKRSKAEIIIFDEKLKEIMEEIKENNETNIKTFICMQKQENEQSLEDIMREWRY